MVFSFFSELLFMALIDSWRVPRSGYLSFGKRGIWRIWWLRNDFCFVFSQKFSHNQAGKFRSFGTSLTATRFIPKTWTTMCWVDPWEMLTASATSLMPTRRFSGTIFFTFSMSSTLIEVDGQLAWGKFSTTSRPSLNALCHSNTWVLDRVDSPKHFCNIFNDSVAVIPLETQNFKQTRSFLFSIVKFARQTFRVVNQWQPNTH